ncbi:MAG: dihydropteroate synthase [Candidatus Zhuqueibacterota bacterium]
MSASTGQVRRLHFNTIDDVERELLAVGVDPSGVNVMAPKALGLSIKIEKVSSPAALILKQEMLSLGGDCANHRAVIKNDVTSTDSILIGSVKIFQRLIPKLKAQPFGLPALAEKIQAIIEAELAPRQFKLTMQHHVLDLSHRTHIMGILNVTPDSFSDGGAFLEAGKAIAQGIRMVEEGADIIDIGAESTRPGAETLPESQELDRLLPVLEGLLKEVAVPISVDTYKSNVAEAALNAGAHVINDISGLRFDPRMKTVVAHHRAPVVLMHIQGEPKNMQQNPSYVDLMGEIVRYLSESIRLAEEAGIERSSVIIDPGIGFGKRLQDNYELLRRLTEFRDLGCPILVGPSRKSFIGAVLNLPPDQRMEGTAAAVALAIQHGAHIVRVHDVKEMSRVCRIADLIVGKSTPELG